MFPENPSILFYDPLGDLLGAGDGRFRYIFDDVVKLSGHACPTVAGAFLMVIRAMELLYGTETPQRGGIAILVPAKVSEGVTGPITQLFTHMTGAAADNGFHGLGGQFVRSGLLRFGHKGEGFTFQRLDNQQQVTVNYDPSAIRPEPTMGPDMQRIMAGIADATTRQRFREAWRGRVLRILADGGANTVRQIGG